MQFRNIVICGKLSNQTLEHVHKFVGNLRVSCYEIGYVCPTVETIFTSEVTNALAPPGVIAAAR
jgi:hypothetical protein